jgi:hypothetical protein
MDADSLEKWFPMFERNVTLITNGPISIQNGPWTLNLEDECYMFL